MITSKKAFTLIEVSITLVIVSMLFISGFSVIQYANRNAQKGMWIQQGISELRNSTRYIGDLIRKNSYPSALIERDSSETSRTVICTYKESRAYNDSGRLRNLLYNDKTDYDMQIIGADGSSSVIPASEDQEIMNFPICKPFIVDKNGRQTPGTIKWISVVLRPSKLYEHTGLGTLYVEEYDDTSRSSQYVAVPTSNEFRYDLTYLNTGFDKYKRSNKPKMVKELIGNVSRVNVDRISLDLISGYSLKNKEKKTHTTSRQLVIFTIVCANDKDKKLSLSDQCCVISRVAVSKGIGSVKAGLYLVWIKNDTAKVSDGTYSAVVSVGDSFEGYEHADKYGRVKAITSNAVITDRGGEITLKSSDD